MTRGVDDSSDKGLSHHLLAQEMSRPCPQGESECTSTMRQRSESETEKNQKWRLARLAALSKFKVT